MNTVSHIFWAVLVQQMTGIELAHVRDPEYMVLPFRDIIPNPWLGLKCRPYETNGADCDKRSNIGYVEIYNHLRKQIRKSGLFIPMTYVLGQVKGYGLHEFLIIGGCTHLSGQLVGRYYHRVADRFEEIDMNLIQEIKRIW